MAKGMSAEDKKNPIKVTIFVHGTRLFPKFYLQELFYSPRGLKRVSELEWASHMHTIAQTLSTASPERFSYEHFYVFGWTGKLNFEERLKAAQALFLALEQLMQHYEVELNGTPELRIIAHSHGGNVVLNLGNIIFTKKARLHIKELILLACPVQEETKGYTALPVFDTCYALTSPVDFLQVADPQKLYGKSEQGHFFSERVFPYQKHLLQAHVNLNGRWIWHIEFFLKSFLTRLPDLLAALDAWQQSEQGSTSHREGKVPVALIEDERILFSFPPK